MTPGRWLAAWAVAYNAFHHLGALPGGLGDAGGATRWVDWLDLATPYAVVGTALAALAAARADRRSWVIGLLGALVYVQGHALHVSANSISNARGDTAPVHLWDEVVGHGVWYAGVALLVVALARAVPVRATGVGLLLAIASGLTWVTNALEGTTAVGSLTVAVGFAAWGWRRRATGGGRLLLAAYGTATLLLLAYGGWHAGFPAPSGL